MGGGQERNLRSGTENVAGIVGLAKAFELAQKIELKNQIGCKKLAQYLWQQIEAKIPKIKLNGPEIGEGRLPNNLNVTFMDVEGEALFIIFG